MARALLLVTLALLATSLAVTPASADKTAELGEKAWNPNPQAPLADVPETEPNNSIATANALGCGNVLRPAAISPSLDEDYFSFAVQVPGTAIDFGTEADGAQPVGDTYIVLYDPSGVQIAADDDSGPGLYSLIHRIAETPGTYWGMVRGYTSSYTGTYRAFVTCIGPDLPLMNDVCTAAFPIGCGSFHDSDSTQLAANDYNLIVPGSCTGYTAAGRDVVYVFSPPPGAALSVTYRSTADASIYIVTDCGDPTGTCVAGEDSTGIGGIEDIEGFVFPGSGPYYMILDSYGANSWGTWTMTGALTCATPARGSTWGQLKSRYR